MDELFPRKSFLPRDEQVENLPYPFNVYLVLRLGESDSYVADKSAVQVK